MRRLAERDASALLGFVSELKELGEPSAFSPRLLGGMQELIPCEAVCYSELDPAQRSSIIQVWRNADGEEGVVWGNDVVCGQEIWWSVRESHPVCGFRVATGDWTTARKVSDFASLSEFRRTAIYERFYRGFVDHWLDVGLLPAPTRTRVFIFTRRSGPDFDERDRLVADLLQPHLAARAETAEAALRAAAALAAIEERADHEGHRVVLCSPDGVVEYASPVSRALLERYLGIENGRIPAAAVRQRELRLARAGRRLHIRIARIEGLRVLMLDERDAQLEKLTPRERQVLDRVARGKENDAIALELGIATATVAKHLEHVFRKLRVPNRTAAAVLLAEHPPGSR